VAYINEIIVRCHRLNSLIEDRRDKRHKMKKAQRRTAGWKEKKNTPGLESEKKA
jgi:hypothetical protein